MGYPESELEREHIREAIKNTANPEEFFKQHLSSFKGSWMEKSYWTIKKHPEFGWGNSRHCYVQLPHVTSLAHLIQGPLMWTKYTPGFQPPLSHKGYLHFWAKKDGLFLPEGGLPGKDSHDWSCYAKPSDLVLDVWKDYYSPEPYGEELGMGGFELIPWQREGYPQKYLLILNIRRLIGSCWLALLEDIDVPAVIG